MRQVFEKQVKDTRVSLSEGTFDHTGIPDAWADVIIIAQVREQTNESLLVFFRYLNDFFLDA